MRKDEVLQLLEGKEGKSVQLYNNEVKGNFGIYLGENKAIESIGGITIEGIDVIFRKKKNIATNKEGIVHHSVIFSEIGEIDENGSKIRYSLPSVVYNYIFPFALINQYEDYVKKIEQFNSIRDFSPELIRWYNDYFEIKRKLGLLVKTHSESFSDPDAKLEEFNLYVKYDFMLRKHDL